jgi:serine/threonine-protein kinase
VDEAVTRLNRLREAEQLRKKAAQKASVPQIKLRTAPKVLSFQDAAAMLGRRNFFENEFNKTGTFKNRYTKKFTGSDAVVMDPAAGLMWYGGPSPGEMTLDRAARWIRELNQQKFAGHSGWRLPTLEEAASLLRRNKNSAGLHIDAVFTGNLRSIWTRDRLRLQTYWVVRFHQGIIYADSDRTKQQVLPVRSSR